MSLLLNSLVAVFLPHVFSVINTLVAKDGKLAPFAEEIKSLEAEVMAVLTGIKAA